MMGFYDPSQYDDDTLQSKISELTEKISKTHMYGAGNTNAAIQLEWILDSLLEEQQIRYAVEYQKMYDAQFPDVISTEPKEKEAVVSGKKVPSDTKKKPMVFDKTYRNKE